tara:strand:+ start:5853 stop:6254 length:402 start_codon:yes stop_codon:yes gene_type:complete
MKVSISYTVDFEDVPEEMLKMTHRALNEYENINFSDLGKALEEKNYGIAIEEIHLLRTKLAEVDIHLNDVASILNGYMKTKYSEAQPADTPQPQPTIEVPMGPESDPGFDMEKTLEELRLTTPNLFPKRKEDQ